MASTAKVDADVRPWHYGELQHSAPPSRNVDDAIETAHPSAILYTSDVLADICMLSASQTATALAWAVAIDHIDSLDSVRVSHEVAVCPIRASK